MLLLPVTASARKMSNATDQSCDTNSFKEHVKI